MLEIWEDKHNHYIDKHAIVKCMIDTPKRNYFTHNNKKAPAGIIPAGLLLCFCVFVKFCNNVRAFWHILPLNYSAKP